MYEIFAVTDIGNCRSKNQDGFIVNDSSAENISHKEHYICLEEPIFTVVFDGVGGTEDGAYAVTEAINYIKTNKIAYDNINIAEYINNLNKHINSLAKDNNIKTASTIVGFIACNKEKTIFNVGDSPAFVINKGFLEKMSTDDTEYAAIFGDSFENPNVKSPLTQYIGGGLEFISPHVRSTNSDYIILCSDGLIDMVSVDEAETIISGNDNVKDVAYELLKAGKSNGGTDNITIVIIKEKRLG